MFGRVLRNSWVAVVLGAAVGIAATSARADVVERLQVGPWLLEANYTSGNFQNCTVKSPYGGGSEVLFMLTRDVAWGLGIRNPTWNLNPGNKGQVRYWIDQRAPRAATASAINRNLLLVPLADSRQLFEEIRWGNVLYFTVDSDTFNMTLKGTAVALDHLMNCVRRHR